MMNPFKKHTAIADDSETNVISFIASDFVDGNTEIDKSFLKETLPFGMLPIGHLSHLMHNLALVTSGV